MGNLEMMEGGAFGTFRIIGSSSPPHAGRTPLHSTPFTPWTLVQILVTHFGLNLDVRSELLTV